MSKNKRYRTRRKNDSGTIIVFLVFLGILSLWSTTKNNIFKVIPDSFAIILGICMLALAAIFVISVVTKKQRKERMYRMAGMKQIDRMSGQEFERYLKTYFKDLGYKVLPHQGGKGDRGGDLLLKDANGQVIVVQAKRYKGKVPYAAVEQVHTAKSVYAADKAMIITTYYLTKQAYDTAKQLGIEVWQRDKLIENMYVYRTRPKKVNSI